MAAREHPAAVRRPRVKRRQRRDDASNHATRCRCWSRTSPACWPASRSLFSRRGFNIQSPRRRRHRAEAPVADDDRRQPSRTPRSSRSPSSSTSCINVIKIVEQEPDNSVAARAAADQGAGRRGRRAARSSRPSNLFRAKVVDVSRGGVDGRGHRHRRRSSDALLRDPRAVRHPRDRAVRTWWPGWVPSVTARHSGRRRPSADRSRTTADQNEKEQYCQVAEWSRCSTTTTPTCRSSRAARSP